MYRFISKENFRHVINIEKLKELRDEGYLMTNVHPKHNLIIWNYTQNTQYEAYWNEFTLQCRALVTDPTGVVVARPIQKFFNYSEVKAFIPNNMTYEIFEKLDGSLGLLFYYGGEWIFTSRGSFESHVVHAANKIWSQIDEKNKLFLEKSYTYIFEVIFPSGRIVVDYHGKESLCLLSAMDIYGNEKTYDELRFIAQKVGFDLVQKYNYKENVADLHNLVEKNKEGFVIRYQNGFRIKIKSEEYVKLHKIMTNITNRDVWDLLSNKRNIETIIDNIPDELFLWINKEIIKYRKQYYTILDEVQKKHFEIINDLPTEYTEKDYALKAKQTKIAHLLFAYKKDVLNQTYVEKIIWKTLYPNIIQKPIY